MLPYCFAVLLLSTASYSAEFSNTVTPDNPQPGGFYWYNFSITMALAMGFYNSTRDTYTPLIFNESDFTFHLRDRDFKTACANTFEMDDAMRNNTIILDGFPRTVVAINGQVPGPPIVVPVGATVVVDVTNNLVQEGITIHWHGQVQKKNFVMDGVGRVTQCPINPGETFRYTFTASNAGTHWYHAHLGVHRTDGAYGPLIVTDSSQTKAQLESLQSLKQDSIRYSQYDKMYYFIVQDWMHDDSIDLFAHVYWEDTKFFPGYGNNENCYVPTKTMDGTSIGPVPLDTILINGKGWHDAITWNLSDPFIRQNAYRYPIETFEVSHDKKYLFRVISASMVHPLRISIDGLHQLTVIATDGNPIQPITTDYLIIHSGERYDFVFNPVRQKPPFSNYWIRVETLETADAKNKPMTPKRGVAILKYTESPDWTIGTDSQPYVCTVEVPCTVVNCMGNYATENFICTNVDDFHDLPSSSSPVDDPNLLLPSYPPNGTDFTERYFNYHFSGFEGFDQRSSINGHQFMLPKAPPFQYGDSFNNTFKTCLNTDPCSTETFDKCTYYTSIAIGSTVQFVLYNMGRGNGYDPNDPTLVPGINGEAHPVHIHGHHFRVLKIGLPDYDNNGQFKGQNKDIDCTSWCYCNGRGWRDSSWNYGNVPGLNLVDPPRKDTIIVPVGGYVVLRFTADNPGWWFLHCHIEVHQAEGMAFMIQEGTPDEIACAVKTPDGFPKCGDFTQALPTTVDADQGLADDNDCDLPSKSSSSSSSSIANDKSTITTTLNAVTSAKDLSSPQTTSQNPNSPVTLSLPQTTSPNATSAVKKLCTKQFDRDQVTILTIAGFVFLIFKHT